MHVHRLTYALQQQICGPELTGRDHLGRCRRLRLDFGDTYDAFVGKMSSKFNKDVILFNRFVHHVSNAKDVFVVGHLFQKVTAALWF